MIGSNAGNLLTTGDDNIFIGYNAGDETSSGANNIVIGYDIDTPTTTSNNTLNIGNLIFGTGIDGADYTLSSGNIGIGTTSPASKLDVWGDFRVGTSGVPTLFANAALDWVGIGTSSQSTTAQRPRNLLSLEWYSCQLSKRQ